MFLPMSKYVKLSCLTPDVERHVAELVRDRMGCQRSWRALALALTCTTQYSVRRYSSSGFTKLAGRVWLFTVYLRVLVTLSSIIECFEILVRVFQGILVTASRPPCFLRSSRPHVRILKRESRRRCVGVFSMGSLIRFGHGERSRLQLHFR